MREEEETRGEDDAVGEQFQELKKVEMCVGPQDTCCTEKAVDAA